MSVSAEEVIACPLSRERHACACGLTLNCRISFIHHVNRLPLYYYKDPDHFIAIRVLTSLRIRPGSRSFISFYAQYCWFQCGSVSGFLSQCGSESGSREPNQCGSGSWSDFKVKKKSNFCMKNIPQINNRSTKQRNYKGTEAFLIGRKPCFFVNFDQFPCSWSLIRIPNTDPDLDRQYCIYFLQTEKSGGVVEKRRSAARECVAQPEW